MSFKSTRSLPLFPIPLKETETTSALKALEGLVATLLADLGDVDEKPPRNVIVDLDRCAAFLFQAYLTTIGGFGKSQKQARAFMKGNL